MPGVRLVNTLPDWKILPLILYCSGAVPPLPNAVMVPLLLPQVAEAGMALTKGLGELVMIMTAEFLQPFKSFTVRV